MSNLIDDMNKVAEYGSEEKEKLYYIISLKHTNREDCVFNWWGPNNSGYTVDLNKAGKYTYDELHTEFHNHDDPMQDTFAIDCSDIDKIAVEREYNYSEWELGRFVLNDEVFYNTYNINPKVMYSVGKAGLSNSRYFRYPIKVETEKV